MTISLDLVFSAIIGGLITLTVAWFFYLRAEISAERQLSALKDAAQKHMNTTGRFLETFAWRLGFDDIAFSRDEQGNLTNALQIAKGQPAKAHADAGVGTLERVDDPDETD